MRSKPVGEKILRGTTFRVTVEGTSVVLTIGDSAVELTYETALKVGKMLWNGGKMAKRAAGDHSRRFIILADLTSEDADEMEAAMSVDRKSVYFRG